jgi:hypothetical protein
MINALLRTFRSRALTASAPYRTTDPVMRMYPMETREYHSQWWWL